MYSNMIKRSRVIRKHYFDVMDNVVSAIVTLFMLTKYVQVVDIYALFVQLE